MLGPLPRRFTVLHEQPAANGIARTMQTTSHERYLSLSLSLSLSESLSLLLYWCMPAVMHTYSRCIRIFILYSSTVDTETEDSDDYNIHRRTAIDPVVMQNGGTNWVAPKFIQAARL